MAAKDPETRRQIARLGAHTAHARNSSEAMTAAGRAAVDAKFEHEVDPEGKLDPAERRRRAQHARKAHMHKLAIRSAQVRKARKAQAAQ
jgi:hypothetical protein